MKLFEFELFDKIIFASLAIVYGLIIYGIFA